MSPAMVDVRSPFTESRIQSQQSRFINPNTKKGQSSSSSSSFSSFSSTLPSGSSDNPVFERLKTETGPMGSPNQRNGAGFYGHGFSTPPPPPPTKPERPSLSKPRLVKLRRHFVSHRAEQSARSGTESRVYLSANANGDGIVGETRDAFQEWNPFSSLPGNSVGENSASLKFGGAAGSAPFVFGAKKASGSGSSLNSKAGDVAQGVQSLAGLKFQDSNLNPEVVSPASQPSHVVNTADAMCGERIARSFQDDAQKSNTMTGANSSGVQPDGASCSESTEGPLNSRSFKFGKSVGDNGFIFGANHLSGSTSSTGMNNVFPQSVGQNDHSGGAALGSNLTPGRLNKEDEDTLPSEIKKLNIEDKTRSENTFEFKQCKSSYVSKKPNPEEVLKTSAVASMEKSVQDELRKLNIGSKNAFQGKGEPEFSFTTDRRANMIPNAGKGFRADVFVFGGRGTANGGVSGQNSTVSSDEKTDIKLSNDMKKLSVEEMRNDSIKDKDTNPTPRDAGSSVLGSSKDDDQESSMCKNSPKYMESEIFINRPFGGSTSGRSAPMPFIFQAGRKTNGLDMDDVPPVIPDANAKPSATASSSSSLPFSAPSLQSEINPLENTATSSTEYKENFVNMRHDLNVPGWDPQTPKHDGSYSFKENIHAGLHQNVVFSAKKGSKETVTKAKKRRGKLKSTTGLVHQKNFVSREGSSQESSEMSSPSYSPMDFSPYPEDTATEQFSRETSLGSDYIVPPSVSMDAQSDQKFGNLSENSFVHGQPDNSLPSQDETAKFNNAAGVTGANTSGFNIESQSGVAKAMSGVEDTGGTNFTFAASIQGSSSTRRRHYRKKSWMKDARDSYTSTPNSEVHLTSPQQFSPFPAATVQGQSHQKEDAFISQKVEDQEPSIQQQSVSAIVAQEACEKWRLRGNQAYANGNVSKAEDCYTQGVNCVSPKETSRSCVRALMLCYSNRAATRMAQGKMREALQDCMMAASIEPNFQRVQLRAATCYLALGETEDALKHFKNCLPSGGDLSLDRKIVIEASDGLQKAKHVFACINQCSKLLQQRTSDNAAKALELTAEALLISPYSECLIQMKAEALLMLRKYEEVVHLCEETVDSAEKNYAMCDSDTQSLETSNRFKEYPARLWRWHLIAKCYFYLGKLEEAFDFLQKHDTGGSTKDINKNLESASAFAGTIQELLRHKTAGNEAFQAGRHLEAVEHYSAALSCSVESRPFAAVCFCNRAAAYQALGQITDAIADCCLAIALDSNYPKAISRRATLHEMIRDYGQATSDLRRLLSLLERQSEDKVNQSRTLGRSASTINDIRQARARLATVEEEAKMEVPLDMYLILGIESSAAAVEIKKAYRKAALRHHPDKAGQFLARSENGDDGLLKEVFDEVHKDADRLFKMIGEAYAVLSDPTKRLRYDAEEEIRIAQKKGGTPKSPVDVHNHPFDKSSVRRQWRSRWSESSRSHRY